MAADFQQVTPPQRVRATCATFKGWEPLRRDCCSDTTLKRDRVQSTEKHDGEQDLEALVHDIRIRLQCPKAGAPPPALTDLVEGQMLTAQPEVEVKSGTLVPSWPQHWCRWGAPGCWPVSAPRYTTELQWPNCYARGSGAMSHPQQGVHFAGGLTSLVGAFLKFRPPPCPLRISHSASSAFLRNIGKPC